MAEINLVLFKSKRLSDGTHPIMISIFHDRKRKYVSTKFSATPDQWDDDRRQLRKGAKNRDQVNRHLREMLTGYLDRLDKLKLSGGDFTILQILGQNDTIPDTVFGLFQTIIDQLRQSGRSGNAQVYAHTYSKFRQFRKDADLNFQHLDYSLLKAFETYLASSKMAGNSMSIHFRTLRAVWNQAIKRKIVPRDLYPFADFRLSNFDTKTRPRALRKEDIDAIDALQFEVGTIDWISQKVFLFMFYTGGTNFVDLCQLRYRDVSTGRIEYTRRKTKSDVRLMILRPALHIIDEMRALTYENDDSYIFPLYEQWKHVTDSQQHNRRVKMNKLVNASLKKIGEDLGLRLKLTTYVSRHSFATVLKRSGQSIAVISELLNHSSEKVTKIYLDQFEDETKDEAMKGLL